MHFIKTSYLRIFPFVDMNIELNLFIFLFCANLCKNLINCVIFRSPESLPHSGVNLFVHCPSYFPLAQLNECLLHIFFLDDFLCVMKYVCVILASYELSLKIGKAPPPSAEFIFNLTGSLLGVEN